MEKDETKFVGGYTKLNSMKLLWVATYNQDNSYDYKILKNIAGVIKSANDETSSFVITPKFEFNNDEVSKTFE